MKPTPCPCGSGKALAACCQPLIRGEQVPPTAEALMYGILQLMNKIKRETTIARA